MLQVLNPSTCKNVMEARTSSSMAPKLPQVSDNLDVIASGHSIVCSGGFRGVSEGWQPSFFVHFHV